MLTFNLHRRLKANGLERADKEAVTGSGVRLAASGSD